MPDDILQNAQKAINDAAGKTQDSPVAPEPVSLPQEPAPEPAVTPSQPQPAEQPKQEEQPKTESTISALNTPGVPPTPEAPPAPAQQPGNAQQAQADQLVSSILEPKIQTTIVPPKGSPPPPSDTPQPKKKSVASKAVIAVIAVLLLALPVGVYFVSQQNQQIADIRDRAAPNYSGDAVCDQCIAEKGSLFFCIQECQNAKFDNGWPCDNDRHCKSGYCDGPSGMCQPESRRLCSRNSDCQSGYCNTVTHRCGDAPPPEDCQPGESEIGAVSYDTAALACANECGPKPMPDPSSPYCNAEIYQTAATSPQNYKWCWKCEGTGTTPPPGGGGGNPPPSDNPTSTPVPVVHNCTYLKIFKDNVQVTPSTLKPGDSVTLAVKGGGTPTKARFRVNGSAWQESTTKNGSGEFTRTYTVPDNVTEFVIEAEVFVDNAWK